MQAFEFDQNWNLVSQRKYLIKVGIRDKKNNNIYISQEMKFDFEFDVKSLKLIEQRQQEIVVQALQPQEKLVIKVKSQMPSEPILLKSQPLSIFAAITLRNARDYLHLPQI